MEYPRRTETHIAESEAWRIFLNAMPPHWIVREVTERDYGIDCYVEIVQQNGVVTGELCSVQLKGTDNIEWHSGTRSLGDESHFPGIKKTTINYWMNLPVPVFLAVADISNKRLYFISVEQQVRSHYSAYVDKKQKSMGFTFFSSLEMGSLKGEFLFFALYLKERYFTEFIRNLSGLVVHWYQYWEFIVDNQERDSFLEVEEDRQLMLMHIYHTCEFLSPLLGVDWDVESLNNAYKHDKQIWKDSYVRMHEGTLDRILKQIEPLYVKILEASKQLVSNTQKEYWINTNIILYNFCQNLDIEQILKR
jgi:hypothetical protein